MHARVDQAARPHPQAAGVRVLPQDHLFGHSDRLHGANIGGIYLLLFPRQIGRVHIGCHSAATLDAPEGVGLAKRAGDGVIPGAVVAARVVGQVALGGDASLPLSAKSARLRENIVCPVLSRQVVAHDQNLRHRREGLGAETPDIVVLVVVPNQVHAEEVQVVVAGRQGRLEGRGAVVVVVASDCVRRQLMAAFGHRAVVPHVHVQLRHECELVRGIRQERAVPPVGVLVGDRHVHAGVRRDRGRREVRVQQPHSAIEIRVVDLYNHGPCLCALEQAGLEV